MNGADNRMEKIKENIKTFKKIIWRNNESKFEFIVK